MHQDAHQHLQPNNFINCPNGQIRPTAKHINKVHFNVFNVVDTYTQAQQAPKQSQKNVWKELTTKITKKTYTFD